MNTTNDGGQAYPSIEQGEDRTLWISNHGMSLRDYMAGQALARMMTGGCGAKYAEAVAKDCYAIADAMIKAREEVKGE